MRADPTSSWLGRRSTLPGVAGWGRVSRLPGRPITQNGDVVQDEQRRDLADRLLRAAAYLNDQMHIARLDEFERSGMSVPQIRTLLVLKRDGPSRMGGLATSIGRTLSAATTVVDRLVEAGLVDRASDPSDRRVVVCQLTRRGHGMAEQFWSLDRDHLQSLTNSLDVDELERAALGLEIICRAERASRSPTSTAEPAT